MKTRMINTRIWNDTWVSQLDPIAKLIFIYLLTNSFTNICGIYELPLKVVAVETGIDPSMLIKMFPSLIPKVYYIEGWVVVKNFPKHQASGQPKVQIGIKNALSEVPSHILDKAIAYGYPIHTHTMYSDSDSDLNKEIDKSISPLKDTDKEVITKLDNEGNVMLSKEKKPGLGKSPLTGAAFRIRSKFAEMCTKNLSTTPVSDTKSFQISLFALKQGKLTENQIYDLFEEWFTLGKPDEELVSITRALSARQIEQYKIRNNIK